MFQALCFILIFWILVAVSFQIKLEFDRYAAIKRILDAPRFYYHSLGRMR